jgi:hypothetical protein
VSRRSRTSWWRLSALLPTALHRYDWRYVVGFVHPASGRTVWHLATTMNIELFSAEHRLAADEHRVGQPALCQHRGVGGCPGGALCGASSPPGPHPPGGDPVPLVPGVRSKVARGLCFGFYKDALHTVDNVTFLVVV